MFFVGKFCPKTQYIGLRIPILAKYLGKVKIVSTHNVFIGNLQSVEKLQFCQPT